MRTISAKHANLSLLGQASRVEGGRCHDGVVAGLAHHDSTWRSRSAPVYPPAADGVPPCGGLPVLLRSRLSDGLGHAASLKGLRTSCLDMRAATQAFTWPPRTSFDCFATQANFTGGTGRATHRASGQCISCCLKASRMARPSRRRAAPKGLDLVLHGLRERARAARRRSTRDRTSTAPEALPVPLTSASHSWGSRCAASRKRTCCAALC
jgi:hypothetical protein